MVQTGVAPTPDEPEGLGETRRHFGIVIPSLTEPSAGVYRQRLVTVFDAYETIGAV